MTSFKQPRWYTSLQQDDGTLAKPWYRSRQLWIGVLQMLIGFSDLLSGSTVFNVPADMILLVTGILAVILRFVTDSKVFWLLLCLVVTTDRSNSLAQDTLPPDTPLAAKTVAEINSAYSLGGPLGSCWNVNTGWNLHKQVEMIQQGRHYMPSIYWPTIPQGANNQRRWELFYAEYKTELALINRWAMPVTLRSHNHLSAWYAPGVDRGPFETSPLIHRLNPDGSLNSEPVVDPLGPIQAWTDLGTEIGGSYWLQQLVLVLPNCPFFILEENNEPALSELGEYTSPLTTGKDAWGYPGRILKPNIPAISVRMGDYLAANPTDPNSMETLIKQSYHARYQALDVALNNALPEKIKARCLTVGYAGLNLKTGVGKQVFSYERPQENWTQQPYSPTFGYFDESSERCYNDGSGGPFDWDDWVRDPAHFQMNSSVTNQYLRATRSLPYQELSFFYSSTRGREAARQGHGGYVLPPRVKGAARKALLAGKLEVENIPTCIRYFAASQEQLADQFYTHPDDPESVRGYTNADFFYAMQDAVDEYWSHPILMDFWRRGKPVVTTDPPFCNWVLPPGTLDDRSRLLSTDADPPRFQQDSRGKTIDRWRATDGKMELNVYAQAFTLDNMVMVFACSAKQDRTNVTVSVPGHAPVFFDTVDQDGEYRILGASWSIH